MDTKLIVALDTTNLKKAEHLVKQLKDKVAAFKIGPELFLAHGFKSIETVNRNGSSVFLDLKFFDIPSVVKKGSTIVSRFDISMFTVHLLGGEKMLKETAEYINSLNKKILMLGVTVLTSASQEDIEKIGFKIPVKNLIMNLAATASKCGVGGLVCSVKELEMIRSKYKENFQLVTPGIRLSNDPKNDQSRVETPLQAAESGADFIVMGRSILNSADPQKTAEEVVKQIWKKK